MALVVPACEETDVTQSASGEIICTSPVVLVEVEEAGITSASQEQLDHIATVTIGVLVLVWVTRQFIYFLQKR